MQPEVAAEARAWFQKSANDIRGAEIDLAAVPPLIEDALFHSQQAAEKAMKGFLTAHETVFRKTHDLDELGRACEFSGGKQAAKRGQLRKEWWYFE